MFILLVAIGSFFGFIVAYHTYGRWLARRIFQLDPDAEVPSRQLRDDVDFVPTRKQVIFGHHFTSIAGTGPIVGPAIAIMWGWLPALLWVVVGSIFIGAVHDFGALVVSLRNRGQTVGDIAGRLVGPRMRILFLVVLIMALWIVLAIFGLVIASVFRMFPESILAVWLQIPIAVGIGLWLHRKGVGLFLPSIIALALMYLTVWFGAACPGMIWEGGALGEGIRAANAWLASWPIWAWVAVLLAYCYVASVLPVWILLQPRDYINALQLITTLGLIVFGIVWVGIAGGSEGQAVEVVAPVVHWSPLNAPPIWPFLFITIACGAISGFHCLVSSGTSSKQLSRETDAQFVGYGSMLTEGFLAVLVILAVSAGIGLGWEDKYPGLAGGGLWQQIYGDWKAADAGLGVKVGAFVVGAANFLEAYGINHTMAVAIMGVMVASFAGTTLDTAMRLQRYVIQELSLVGQAALPLLKPLTSVTKTSHGATMLAAISAFLMALPPRSVQIPLSEAWSGQISEESVVAAQKANVPAPVLEAIGSGGTDGLIAWVNQYLGTGGLILWPLFGATNQLLAGLAFLVTAFYLWRRNKPIWFLILPMLVMIVMPAWALVWQMFNTETGWVWPESRNYLLLSIGAATLALQAWMVIEALLTWPRARGVLEEALPPLGPARQLAAGRSS